MNEPTLAEQIAAAISKAVGDISTKSSVFMSYPTPLRNQLSSRLLSLITEEATKAALATLEASQTCEIIPLEIEIRAYVECYGNRCDSDKSLEFRYLRSTLSLLDDERKRVAIRPNHAAVWQEAEDAKRFDENLEAQFNCFEEAVEGRTQPLPPPPAQSKGDKQ